MNKYINKKKKNNNDDNLKKKYVNKELVESWIDAIKTSKLKFINYYLYF